MLVVIFVVAILMVQILDCEVSHAEVYTKSPVAWRTDMAGRHIGIKKARIAGFFLAGEQNQLLDFGFLINNMLAYDGIKFLDLHLVRHVFLVLGRGVEVTSTS